MDEGRQRPQDRGQGQARQEEQEEVSPPHATAPRVVEFIVAKRNLPLTWRSYGHWWIEVDDDESFGWWPAESPVGLHRLLRGTAGVLNDARTTPAGTLLRDPNHGLLADYEFSPVLVVECSDDELRRRIRAFAATFRGEWRWSTRPTMNCRLFQLALFDAVGLVDGTGNYLSRGSGCPALAPARRSLGRLTGQRIWPRNLPAPGQRVDEIGVPTDGCGEKTAAAATRCSPPVTCSQTSDGGARWSGVRRGDAVEVWVSRDGGNRRTRP